MADLIMLGADLGASGGKMARGSFDGKQLSVSDFYDFDNIPVKTPNAFYWDIFGLYQSIIKGIRAYTVSGQPAASVAVDTWGASYGFLDKQNRLLEPVYHYRDQRTQHSVAGLHKHLDQKTLFQMTGCQCNRTYTLPQLYSYIEHDNPVIHLADKMLFLPDLLSFFLSGEISTERTIAGTSALMDTSQENWCLPLFEQLSLPAKILTGLVDAGTVKGELLHSIQTPAGAHHTKVIAATGHDSASAVAAIPGFGQGKLYISIGTNVSMGIEQDESIVSDTAYACGFKNTGGLARKKIVYRDFSAFWLMNEFLRIRAAEGRHFSYQELTGEARKVAANQSYIDVEEAELNNAGGDIRLKINTYLRQTGQPALQTDGAFIRCILESITLKIRHYAGLFRHRLQIPCTEVFAINGGSRNHLLMQMLSNAFGTEIKAGMPYATLAGNILTQLYALGQVSSLNEIRELSKQSFHMETFLPQETGLWEEKFQHFRSITNGGERDGQAEKRTRF